MLYIHIPFCKSRCIYCNFFSTTRHKLLGQYEAALTLQLQRLEAAGSRFSTIYLGGGTPSYLLSECAGLLTICGRLLAPDGEFTVECNPDDVSPTLSALLHDSGVNRVSLGIQTFSDARLAFLNRRHTADKARQAVAMLRDHGISNISIDLMYGFPGESLDDWQRDIDEALSLNPEHISAYCLTIEEGTPLHDLMQSAAPFPLGSAAFRASAGKELSTLNF
ncbi:MAG: radical SAM protein [Oscillospiraceae bacterium]|nr:radical SAM protein [Oscillospiraceae bacterium]